MRSALNGFNSIARHYDVLKELVFGKSIYQSQAFFLDRIPRGGKVLVIGGGSGEMLGVLNESNPEADICFVEASSEMLRLAAKRLREPLPTNVQFIHGTERDVPANILFDAVITNFFLDLFPDQKAREICSLISDKLKIGGVWLVSDFVNGKAMWQRLLLWVMYRFFVSTCGVEARALPTWERHIKGAHMEEMVSQSFFRGFIRSVVYKRKATHFT